jgi:hypothetical protein
LDKYYVFGGSLVIKFCQNCKKNNIIKYDCVGGYYWSYLDTATTCNECGNEFINIDFSALDLKILMQVSKDINFIEAMIKLHDENIIEYETRMSQFRTQVQQQESNQVQANNVLKCPTCNSIKVKRISGTAKLAGAVAFGLFSKTARSQFKCENCGYKW